MDWAAIDELRVVHVGQSGLLLADPTRDALVPITSTRRGLQPAGLAVSDVGVLLRAGATPNRSVSLARWRWARREVVDLRVRADRVDPHCVDLLARLAQFGSDPFGAVAEPSMDPRPQRRLAPVLAACVVHGRGSTADAVAQLVGAGPGATPSGDDVIVGTLAGVDLADRAGLLTAAARTRVAGLRAVVGAAAPRTTAAARHDLLGAVRGSYCERVHRMLAAVAGHHDPRATVSAARMWGATSGIDLLCGVVTATATAQVPASLGDVA